MNIPYPVAILFILATLAWLARLTYRQNQSDRQRLENLETLSNLLFLLSGDRWRVVGCEGYVDPYAPGDAGDMTIIYPALAYPQDVAEDTAISFVGLRDILEADSAKPGDEVRFWLSCENVPRTPAKFFRRLRCTVVSRAPVPA